MDRSEALEQPAQVPLSPVERVDQVAQFGAPRLWIALIGIIALILAALAWATIARSPETISVDGIISTQGGVLEATPSRSGTITGVFVEVGEKVVAGNNLAEVEDDSGTRFRVQAPADGTVIELIAQVGGFAEAGVPVALMQESKNELFAIAFVPMDTMGPITPGDVVLVSPATAPASAYGYAQGVVTDVARLPMSAGRVAQLVGNLSGYEGLVAAGMPIIEVRVALVPDASTPSGIAWTQGSGPPHALIGQTPWSGEIVVGEHAPIEKILG